MNLLLILVMSAPMDKFPSILMISLPSPSMMMMASFIGNYDSYYIILTNFTHLHFRMLHYSPYFIMHEDHIYFNRFDI